MSIKIIIFRRLKVLNLLLVRAYNMNDYDKFEKIEKRIKLINYHLKHEPLVNL